MRIVAAFAIVFVSTPAAADTVTGEQAINLTYALHYAGVSATKAKDVQTYNLAAADCVKTTGDAGRDDDFRCAVGKTQIKDAAAFLLYTMLKDAGVRLSMVADNKFGISAKAVTCVIDPAASETFQCSADAIVVRPAATTKVKDIVQPVKIQKQ